MRKLILIALLAVSVAFVESCSKSDDVPTQDNSTAFDRKAMLTNLSTTVIIPAYALYQTDINNLNAAVTAFNASPDITKLSALQDAFKMAYRQWQNTSVFEFGPAEKVTLRVNTNTYPTDVTQINANVTSGTYNPDFLANLSAKGLPALDYLLFGTGVDNAAILLQFTSDSKATNRKAYLASLTTELKKNADAVVTAWNGDYKTTFVNADGTDIGSSTGLLVNQLIYDYEILKNYEVGIPSGVQSMGTIFPTKVQAYYSKMSEQLALLHIQAIQNIYLGKSSVGDGPGLDDYLVKVNAKYNNADPLNDVIKSQFTAAITKLQALSDPLSAQITNNTAAVTSTYAELQKLTVLLKTDMTSSLAILITYGDNDGD